MNERQVPGMIKGLSNDRNVGANGRRPLSGGRRIRRCRAPNPIVAKVPKLVIGLRGPLVHARTDRCGSLAT